MSIGQPDHEQETRQSEDLTRDIDVTVTRNASDYITQIVKTDGTVTKTLTITRDGDNYITAIATAIT